MTEDRKEITLEQVAEAKRKGLDFILDNLEVKGVAVIKGKDGKIKGQMELTSIKED
jgi:CheY-specific phosphatase CheX